MSLTEHLVKSDVVTGVLVGYVPESLSRVHKNVLSYLREWGLTVKG